MFHLHCSLAAASVGKGRADRMSHCACVLSSVLFLVKFVLITRNVFFHVFSSYFDSDI